MYQQRKAASKGSFARTSKLWAPTVVAEGDRTIVVAPRPGDRYVVVDEIIGEVARLVTEDWPTLDRAGRLHFPGAGEVAPGGFEVTDLEAVVNTHRDRHGQILRDLRVGDVFQVRGFGPRPDRWRQVFDVTSVARIRAGNAHLRAVAPPARRRRPRAEGPARRPAPILARAQPSLRPGSVALPGV